MGILLKVPIDKKINFFVSYLTRAETNNAVIADFGIAHFCEEDIIASVKTKASDRMANFQYAAPEQRIKGNAKNVDGRADVYAAGLILVEMFTGELVGAGNYTKISKVAPEYKYLDDVFNELFLSKSK